MNNSIKGEKHICSNCGAKFFDLNKSPIICPKCNTEVVKESSSVRAKTFISKPQENDNNIDNIETEDLDAIQNEDAVADLEEDEIDNNENDNTTSTIVNID
tara:strand:+ start:272 stop:574 length:303 start_codon:yes stop_codon:yes gene_type:complete